MEKERILRFNLKKVWFDKVVSGLKCVEWRENKPYWRARLLNPDGSVKTFDLVELKNGYQKNAPRILLKWKSCSLVNEVNDLDVAGTVFKIELGQRIYPL